MFLGLDFGTSGARACLIDPAKHIVWTQAVAYSQPDTQQATDWRVALHCLLRAIPPSFAAQLSGIAIDATSGTIMLCDAQLAPCSPALLYNDNRAQAQAAQLKQLAPVGHPVGTATSGLAKFLWLTEQSTCESAAYCLHQADWLAALLSGQAGISDYHNALKTGYDVANLCWPDWLLALPHSQLLPHVVAPGERIADIQPNIARHFGINPQCQIHAGTTDSIAAFIASNATRLGTGVTSLGSTLVLKQLSDKRIDAPEYGIYSHRYGDKWLVGGASNAGAGVLKTHFNDAQLSALSEQIHPELDSPLDYYPLKQMGERFPINDAQLAPRLTPRPHNDVAFLQGLLQGLSKIEAAGYCKLAELGAPPIQQVISNGGGAKNITWQKMRARILGVPVTQAEHSEAAYGAALLCHPNPPFPSAHESPSDTHPYIP